MFITHCGMKLLFLIMFVYMYVLYKFAKKMIDGICSKNEQTSHDFFDKLFESRFKALPKYDDKKIPHLKSLL